MIESNNIRIDNRTTLPAAYRMLAGIPGGVLWDVNILSS